MTIEQKAQRYDEAIERAKSIHNETVIPSATSKGICTYIFPELKENKEESTDEKIRKALIKLVTNHASMDLFIEYDIHLDEVLAWLEKQGEHNPVEVRTIGYWNVQDIEQKLVWSEEVEKLKSQLLRGACSSQIAMETMCKEEAYNEVLAILDTMQKEPVSVWHDTIDMPDNEKKILVVGFNGEAYAGYYNGVCNPKKIKHWAYIDELLKL